MATGLTAVVAAVTVTTRSRRSCMKVRLFVTRLTSCVCQRRRARSAEATRRGVHAHRTIACLPLLVLTTTMGMGIRLAVLAAPRVIVYLNARHHDRA